MVNMENAVVRFQSVNLFLWPAAAGVLNLVNDGSTCSATQLKPGDSGGVDSYITPPRLPAINLPWIKANSSPTMMHPKCFGLHHY